MELLLNLLFLISILAIGLEDFKHREIHLYWIIASFLLSASCSLTSNPLLLVVKGALFNFFYLLICFIGLYIVARQKRKDLFQLTAEGDWLMFAVFGIIFWENLFYFILFLIGCFFIGIVINSLLNLKRKESSNEIPLAGYLSVGFLIYFVLQFIGFESVNTITI